jgi:signal peptidase II
MLSALVIYSLRSRLSPFQTLGLTLFVAGGAANLLDRIQYGRVVDFMNLGIGPVRTGIFNVADVALMIGAALFAWSEFKQWRVARHA